MASSPLWSEPIIRTGAVISTDEMLPDIFIGIIWKSDQAAYSISELKHRQKANLAETASPSFFFLSSVSA